MDKHSENIDDDLLKPYNPQDSENDIYKTWEESGYFNPDICIEKGVCKKDAEPFSIVLPPPNVTGTLHIGHSLMLVIEDIMVRYHRMQGKRTLWVPGTDHASIATESKVAKVLEKEEKKRKHDLGRDEFLKRVDTFAKESHGTITGQLKTMGSSVDWSREAFTLDEQRSVAVRHAFKSMYDMGLIYRGSRIVNWDPKGQTTISDDEIVFEERTAKIYTFKYAKDFPISIATTRPETKVGDTAVAVHPDDDRYKQYIGKEFELEFAGVPISIRVVGDKAVDPEFGTGAVGVTPAHSPTDWEIAERHDLPVTQVINEYAKMSVEAPDLAGKKTTVAREIIVEWLRNNDLLEDEQETQQNVGTAERTGAVIEPLPKLQWFINVNKEFPFPHDTFPGIKAGEPTTLKKLMLMSVKDEHVNIVPERFNKVYYNWIDNLRDWCISRQIWYGHRIPVWYKGNEIYVGTEAPQEDGWEQDTDTLDTWFSSGLWTFSTLGWPEKTDDLKTYHPTSVLETGYDIIFFWVARMVLMSTFHLGEVPFKTVYFHGLVRDKQNKKISKSLGNNIDPVVMSEKYGTDALRMSLIIGTGPGNDSKMSEDKIKAYKHFANKLWNATRFVLSNTDDFDISTRPQITESDKEILRELEAVITDVTNDMENFRFYLAGEKLYHYFWHTFADIVIEESKPLLETGTAPEKASRQYTLLHILTTSLKALHPFMPFVTEKIWSMIPDHAVKKERDLLMVERWPSVNGSE